MDIKKELREAGQYLKSNQLAWGTSGNISAISDDGHMVITASGTYLANLNDDDFVICEIATGNYEGRRKASKETPMHTGIYRQRDDVKAVLHSSPFYTTLFACSNEEIISKLFIETMYYLENIAYVDYFHPGTQELGDAVSEQAAKANIIILKNHGVVVYDDSISEAIMRLETLEMACKMILKAKECSVKLNHIPDTVVKSFLEESRYKPRKNIK
ncbi:class II aldolase/adducin family protein [Metabacillus herbersteinensis]|uniref:Class II aldolase/adducin family protein n=1 Tax=Metabacillus herbersteinensis TaxID=283816 RepID=A0ABV6GLM8_9BACI